MLSINSFHVVFIFITLIIESHSFLTALRTSGKAIVPYSGQAFNFIYGTQVFDNKQKPEKINFQTQITQPIKIPGDLSIDMNQQFPGLIPTKSEWDGRIVYDVPQGSMIFSYTPNFYGYYSPKLWGVYGCMNLKRAIGHDVLKPNKYPFYMVRVYETSQPTQVVSKDNSRDRVHEKTVEIVNWSDVDDFSNALGWLKNVVNFENRFNRKVMKAGFGGYISPHDESEIMIPEKLLEFKGYLLIMKEADDKIIEYTKHTSDGERKLVHLYELHSNIRRDRYKLISQREISMMLGANGFVDDDITDLYSKLIEVPDYDPKFRIRLMKKLWDFSKE